MIRRRGKVMGPNMSSPTLPMTAWTCAGSETFRAIVKDADVLFTILSYRPVGLTFA
jgi:hypothetical protein